MGLPVAAALCGFNPVVLVGGAAAITLYCAYKLATQEQNLQTKSIQNHNNQPRETPVERKSSFQQRQEAGDVNSSEVETHFNLGEVDTYSNIKRFKRPFSKGEDGDKGYVEADHIPPLESLRRAEAQPGFSSLRNVNRNLYNMVMSLRNDPRGENLMTVQVSTHHHRDALSTGASRVSRECRLLLSRTIARGQAEKMLKQAFIIAHPYASQQIRDDAEMGNKLPKKKSHISKDRTIRIYVEAFIKLLHYYFYEKGIINKEEYRNLMKYVINYGFLDRESDEYEEILDIVKHYM